MSMFNYSPQIAINKENKEELKLIHFGQINNFWFNKFGLYEIPGSGSTTVHYDGQIRRLSEPYTKYWENEKYIYGYEGLLGKEGFDKSYQDFRKRMFNE